MSKRKMEEVIVGYLRDQLDKAEGVRPVHHENLMGVKMTRYGTGISVNLKDAMNDADGKPLYEVTVDSAIKGLLTLREKSASGSIYYPTIHMQCDDPEWMEMNPSSVNHAIVILNTWIPTISQKL